MDARNINTPDCAAATPASDFETEDVAFIEAKARCDRDRNNILISLDLMNRCNAPVTLDYVRCVTPWNVWLSRADCKRPADGNSLSLLDIIEEKSGKSGWHRIELLLYPTEDLPDEVKLEVVLHPTIRPEITNTYDIRISVEG